MILKQVKKEVQNNSKLKIFFLNLNTRNKKILN